MPTETMTFGPLVVAFDERVLRPRPWTLLQASWAAELAVGAPAGPILELCSGAGHIGQAAAVLSGRGLVQVDVDPHACALAEANAAAIGYATTRGALFCHAYDQPEIAAGAGTLAEEILEDEPGIDTIVVAVGGLGRITGVFYAALIIGVLDFTLKKYFPQGGTVFIYAMTILLLLWRPQGLFGRAP